MKRDRLCPLLTVMELMRYATDLKVGSGISRIKKEQLVSLGLS